MAMRGRRSPWQHSRRAATAAVAVLAALGLVISQALAAPTPTIAPATWDFGASVVVGTTATKTITVTNTGDGTLKLTSIGFAPTSAAEFTLRPSANVTNGCAADETLSKNEQCAIEVLFTPSGTDPVAGELDVATDAAPTTPLVVSLQGTGAPASTQPPPAPPPPPPTALTPPPPPTKDLDKDGVVDALDACPLVPGTPPDGCNHDTAPLPDRDDDGVANVADDCPTVPGDRSDGCPSRLDADVHGHWRVNSIYSQLVRFTVRSAIGSRIEVRCSRSGCGFTKRTISSTTSSTTNLVRFFKGKRILPPGLSITVRVTRPKQVGTYERLQTRSGRKLPKVVKRCLSALSGAVGICAS